MTRGYTLDTNIIRPLLRKDPQMVERISRTLRSGIPVRFNALSYYETKRGLLAVNATAQLIRFERLATRLGILMLDQVALDKGAEIYADLRRQGALIEDADLLIAATAIAHNVCLVTNNVSHFARVPELVFEDWLS